MPNEHHGIASYMNVDSRLDPEANDLPIARRAELISMNVEVMPMDETVTRLRDHTEERALSERALNKLRD